MLSFVHLALNSAASFFWYLVFAQPMFLSPDDVRVDVGVCVYSACVLPVLDGPCSIVVVGDGVEVGLVVPSFIVVDDEQCCSCQVCMD